MLSYSIVFLKDKRIKLPPLTFCYKTFIFFKATEAATESVYKIWEYLESLFDKVSDLQDCKPNKKRLHDRRFPVNLAKSFKILTLKNICEGLPLTELF